MKYSEIIKKKLIIIPGLNMWHGEKEKILYVGGRLMRSDENYPLSIGDFITFIEKMGEHGYQLSGKITIEDKEINATLINKRV